MTRTATFKGLLGAKLGMTQIFNELGQQVPVTVIWACTGIVKSGNAHAFPASSRITPPVMKAPTCPTQRKSQVEKVGLLRRMPLILTTDERPLPCAVAGE